MAIDVHAHYVPTSILNVLRDRGKDYGVSVVTLPPACQECLRFDYGLQIRPFSLFTRLLEPIEARIESMDRQGIDRQVLSLWLATGSLIMSGVLDRFPRLQLILSHGGGALPYLIGRFDCMHERMDRAAIGNVALAAPSSYLDRMHYDTILHDTKALRYLAQRVEVQRLVLGSDDPFPPANLDPLASLRAAGFTPYEIRAITEDNPRRLFR